MNKIFRTKSASGGLTVRLDRISSVQYTIEAEGVLKVEILTTEGPLDATLTSAELDALHQAWNEAL